VTLGSRKGLPRVTQGLNQVSGFVSNTAEKKAGWEKDRRDRVIADIAEIGKASARAGIGNTAEGGCATGYGGMQRTSAAAF
jgi:hypothetical protein